MWGFGVIILTFLLMESVTWLTHRYVMHGFMWYFHSDHHRPQTHFWERNDIFFVIFAIPSMALIISGTLAHFDIKFFIGMGIMFYGMAYFLIHDVLIHQRFDWFKRVDNVYFRALRKAHKVHHKHLNKEDGECFGMLLVPFKYFREAYQYSQKVKK